MMDKHKYLRLWRKVPYESAPPDLCAKIIHQSGIQTCKTSLKIIHKPFYLLADLAMVMAILLLIGVNLQKTDNHARERLTTNVICLAQQAASNLQTVLFENGRNDF